MSEVTVYGATFCGYCTRVKDFLTRMKIPFTYVDIEDDSFDKQHLVTVIAPGAKTIPIVTVDGEWIGGYEDTVKHFT